jgi:polysaccharide export outer membrane protein
MSSISKLGFFFLSLIFLQLFNSCTLSKNFKHYVYLSDTIRSTHLTVGQPPTPKLRIGDRIQIIVTALNPAAAQAFNQGGGQLVGGIAGGGSVGSGTSSNAGIVGYLINSNGNIQFPQIGSLHVTDLTTDSIEKMLEIKLLQFLKDPVVTVSQTNFNINVIGEVGKPGVINVQDGKITILEAISKSGDLTVMGKRENVLVVREKNGKREFGRLDLTSNNLFNSPYYYLEQGDVIYVDVNQNKLLGADVLQQRRISTITIVLGILSTLVLIKTYLRL